MSKSGGSERLSSRSEFLRYGLLLRMLFSAHKAFKGTSQKSYSGLEHLAMASDLDAVRVSVRSIKVKVSDFVNVKVLSLGEGYGYSYCRRPQR